jgi:hypothetical protein
MTKRTNTITRKIKTEFGSMYVHIELDATGRPVGGSISTPGKEPESQIAQLVETLSNGLDEALRVATP